MRCVPRPGRISPTRYNGTAGTAAASGSLPASDVDKTSAGRLSCTRGKAAGVLFPLPTALLAELPFPHGQNTT